MTRAPVPQAVRQLLMLAAIVFEAEAEQLLRPVGRLARDDQRARWAVWLALRARGCSSAQIARWFAVDSSTVRHGWGRAEALGLPSVERVA